MSVYKKEKAEYLKIAMNSMFEQTVPTNDFVLVCDGPLTEELDAVIDEMKAHYPDVLNVVRLSENMGLGNALNEGLKHCKNELVARMDSDDISLPNRCEKQIDFLEKNPDLSLISGTVIEFENTMDNIVGKRALPETNEEIKKFMKKRCPFNHPAVIFKKSVVDKSGGYNGNFPYFEDYCLWIRIISSGNKGYNISDPILYMRTSSNMYMRRGGKQYAKYMIDFRRRMYKNGITNRITFYTTTLLHFGVCIIPNKLRNKIYCLFHK